MALLLAAMGIYGIAASIVTQRTREIGIRLSLGARRTDVIMLLLRQGLSLVAIGTVMGCRWPQRRGACLPAACSGCLDSTR